jgi:hypothetical protein
LDCPLSRAVTAEVRAGRQTGIMVEALFYLLFCLLTGLCGIQRRLGFFGTFLLSLVLTPIPILLLLLLTGPSKRIEVQQRPPEQTPAP